MRIIKILLPRSFSTGSAFQARVNAQVDQLSKSTASKKSTLHLPDVEHHSRLSNTWWDINGEIRGLHALNPLRVQFLRDGLANTGIKGECASQPLNGIKVLDVGCGGGILSEPLARIGAEVTGIDASSDLIAVAKHHAALDPDLNGKINYVQTLIENFSPDNKEQFNAVIASEVIEHVDNKELFLKCCIDTLKPGGSIFLTTFNKTLPAWLGGIIAAEHVFKFIPKGTHDWHKFITPAEMQCLLESCGCKTKLIHGIFYNPIKNDWSWITSTAINYAIHAVKRTGVEVAK